MELQSKRDFTALMRTLLDPLTPLYSPGGARLRLGETGVTYDKPAIELEGFSRPLWALAPFWLGGGRWPEMEAIYQKGLAAGTDPDGPEYWGDTKDYDQRFVEMAAIACAILEVPEVVWEPLDGAAKKHLARWLYSVNERFVPRCNWLFFRVLVDLALESVGMPFDEAAMERDLAEMDGWYVSDGWYTDGPADVKPQKDYYIPWALQYYGVLYSVFAAERDPDRAAVYRKRAMEFGRSFARWFDENGAALPYGRSLTYRFGQCAFYSACVWAGLEPLPLPVMKGIIVHNLQWWLDKPILDRDGVLTIGYCYPNLYMSERYNAPGSPYWGMKSFLLLALPEDHPFWSVQAAPLPEDIAAPGVYPQHATGLLLQRLPDGQLNAYAPGAVERSEHGQFAEKYTKFCYNTRFGFSASRSYAQLEQAAPDSMLAFALPGEDGGWTFVRRHSVIFDLQENYLFSSWRPMPGVSVSTYLIPCEGGHIRRHTVESEIACTAYDCGFAVPRFAAGFAQRAEGDQAEAHNDRAACQVRVRSGNGEGVIVDAWPNTNLYSPNTVIPAAKYDIRPGTTYLETIVTSQVR